MYCVHILFFCYTFHILDLSYTFRVIDTLLLVLVYLSSHSNAMLLISCHIFSTFHLFYVSCLHKPYKWIKETMRARRCCTHCMKQWSMRARRRYTHCMKQWSMRARRRCGDPFGATVIQTGSMSSTQTGPRYQNLYAVDLFFLIGMPIYPSIRF